MRVLLDTSILLCLIDPAHPEYPAVRAAVDALVARGDQVCFVPQNLLEFWCVCTRPAARNGFGLSGAETDLRIKLLEGRLLLLPDSDRIPAEWRRLVLAYPVQGAQVYEARLVAAMLSHGISRLLTMNKRDFERYATITAMDPHDLVASG